VDWNGQRAKASRDVKAGDRVKVETPGGEFEVEVLDVSEERGPAVVAQKLYAESDESKEKRAVAKAEQKVMNAVFAAPVTKPSKRDRRVLMKFRGR
jgi:ribosome-associated heat shock protein Hsp15